MTQVTAQATHGMPALDGKTHTDKQVANEK